MSEKLDTRERILQAAVEVFTQKSFVETSVDNITQAAGVSHGTFYTYFKNKRDVLMELVKEIFTKLYYSTQEPWKRGNTYSSLEASVRGWFNVQSEHWKIIRTWKEAAYTDEELMGLWDHLADKITLRIQQNIEASMRNNICRKVRPSVAARAISGMIEHFANLVLFRQQEYDLEEVITTIADLWYHALYIIPEP
jgi:AcrR family transcriptional regulator